MCKYNFLHQLCQFCVLLATVVNQTRKATQNTEPIQPPWPRVLLRVCTVLFHSRGDLQESCIIPTTGTPETPSCGLHTIPYLHLSLLCCNLTIRKFKRQNCYSRSWQGGREPGSFTRNTPVHRKQTTPPVTRCSTSKPCVLSSKRL